MAYQDIQNTTGEVVKKFVPHKSPVQKAFEEKNQRIDRAQASRNESMEYMTSIREAGNFFQIGWFNADEETRSKIWSEFWRLQKEIQQRIKLGF